jgi:hypothetical protein
MPTIAAHAEPAVTPVTVAAIDREHIEHATHHVQGLAVSADGYWISSVDRAAKQGHVYRVDRATGKVVAARELTFGPRFHPGGIDLAAGALWVPVAEYRPRSTTTILKLDPTTLATLASFDVDDHIGCLAVIAEGEILAANWDARVFRRFGQDGKALGETPNPRPTAYQDLKMSAGLIVGCGSEKQDGRQTPVVDRFDPRTLALVSRWLPRGTLRTGGSNFCREGCALFEGQLFLMPEDGPDTTIYRFALPAR